MEKKKRTEYNTEYIRKKRGSMTRQNKGNILENTVRIELRLKEDMAHKFKEVALSQEKGVNQLMRELIEEYLKDK